jgi:hypothetical protein
MLQQVIGGIRAAVKRFAGVWLRKHESAKQAPCGLAHANRAVFQIIRLDQNAVCGSSNQAVSKCCNARPDPSFNARPDPSL